MKKVLLSVVLMFAVCATSSVMAQDVKKDVPAQKTECAKTCNKDIKCSKSEEKKCCKSEEKKCTAAADKKCCKTEEKKCATTADKKCCKENKQATAGKN